MKVSDWIMIAVLLLGLSSIGFGVYTVASRAGSNEVTRNRAVCFDFKGTLNLNIKENNIHYTEDGIEWGDDKGKYKLFAPPTGLLCSIIKED